DAPEAARLEHVEQLRLELRRQLPDLVEEQRAAIRDLDQAALRLPRVGKGAALVAEELSFQQMRREGGAIDLDKARLRLSARVMERSRNEVLARPALAEQEHRRVGNRRDALHEIAYLLDCRLIAENGAGRELCLPRARERRRLLAHRPLLERAPELRQQLVHVHRLEQIIGGARLERGDR